MRNRDISFHLEEIGKFLQEYRAGYPSGASEKSSLKLAYKRFHAVLVWQMYIDSSDYIDAAARQYTNEFVADISQSFLTALMGFYKPSKMMLRSSIENFARVACIMDGKDPLKAKTVFDLMNILKTTSIRSTKETDDALLLIIQNYGDLCEYVHTTSPLRMDLRIPFAQVVNCSTDKATSCFEQIGRLSQAINKIFFKLRSDLIVKMHHKDADFVRDLIPASLKRA